MGKVYEILKNTDAIIYDSQDSGLRGFLELYYTFTEPDKTKGFENVLVYTENFRESLLLIPGVKYIWSKYALPEDARQFLSEEFVIEKKDIKMEYIQRFLSNCT
jgi:hypothetical protein